jgi:hypothetical protein
VEYKSKIAVLEMNREQKEDETYNIIEELNQRTRAALYSERSKAKMD